MIRLTDKIKAELIDLVSGLQVGEGDEIDAPGIVGQFAIDNRDAEWGTRGELNADVLAYAREWLVEPVEDIDEAEADLTTQELAFCKAYTETQDMCSAYRASHPDGTMNYDSVRSLASRYIRRKPVARYIHEWRARCRQSAIECGIWTRTRSLLERADMLDKLKSETETRQNRLSIALAMVCGDNTLTDGEKAQRIMQALSRPIYSKDVIDAHKALCDALDGLSWTNDRARADWYDIPARPANAPETLEARQIRRDIIDNAVDSVLPPIYGETTQC